jgi:hypothetical protein
VIVAEGECQLERQRRIKPWIAGLLKRGERVERVKYGVDEDVCNGDHACIRLSGCPTLTLKDNPDPLKRRPGGHRDRRLRGLRPVRRQRPRRHAVPQLLPRRGGDEPILARAPAGALARLRSPARCGRPDGPTLNHNKGDTQDEPDPTFDPGRRGGLGAGPCRVGAGLPARPVKLVVNFPPGGAADVIGRALAQQLSEQVKQQVVVENKPGANGNLGADAVAKAPADGSTLLMSSGGAVTVNPFLYTKMPFDAERDLVPVASVARVLVFLMTNPSVPVNNGAGVHRLRQGQPRQAELRLGRQRQLAAPGRRDVQAAGQVRGHAHPLPRRRAGAGRPAGRPGAVHVRPRPRPAPREGRQAQAAGRGQPETLVAGAGHADAGRGWAWRASTPTPTFGIYAPGGTPAPWWRLARRGQQGAGDAAKAGDHQGHRRRGRAADARRSSSTARTRDRERFGAFIKRSRDEASNEHRAAADLPSWCSSAPSAARAAACSPSGCTRPRCAPATMRRAPRSPAWRSAPAPPPTTWVCPQPQAALGAAAGVQPEPGAGADRPAAVVGAAGDRAPRGQRHGQPPNAPTSISSTARALTVAEKMQLGDGRVDSRGAGGHAAAPRAGRRAAGPERAGAPGRHRHQRGAAGRSRRQRPAAAGAQRVRGHHPRHRQGRGGQPARLCAGVRP